MVSDITKWAGMVSTVLILLASLAVGGRWVWSAGVSHAQTAENTKTTKRIVDVLEGIMDLRCRDEIRRCVEKAQKDGTDPALCADLTCAKQDEP